MTRKLLSIALIFAFILSLFTLPAQQIGVNAAEKDQYSIDLPLNPHETSLFLNNTLFQNGNRKYLGDALSQNLTKQSARLRLTFTISPSTDKPDYVLIKGTGHVHVKNMLKVPITFQDEIKKFTPNGGMGALFVFDNNAVGTHKMYAKARAVFLGSSNTTAALSYYITPEIVTSYDHYF